MHWLFEPAAWQRPGLSLQTRWRQEVEVQQLASGVVVVSHIWGAQRLDGISPAILASLQRLASDWVDQSELWSLAAGPATASPAEIAIALSRLSWVFDQLGFLCRLRLVADGKPLMTVEPLASDARLAFSAGSGPGHAPRLSRFAYLQRHDDGLAMESAVAAHRVVLHDAWGACLAGWLAKSREFSPADPAEHAPAKPAALGLLGGAGMLEGSEPDTAGIGGELLQMGEFHDLLFHRRSRYGRHDGPFGAEFPFRDTVASPRALREPFGETAIPLPAPDKGEIAAADCSLSQALERRVSIRQFGGPAMTLKQLGEFLFRCARTRGRYGPIAAAGMPYQACDRPYPSGGGIHDLELFLVVGRIEDLRAGAYHYAADRHALEWLAAGEEDVSALLKGAMRASGAPEPPPVLIKVVSRFGRMSWKYRSISYATTLKNVGVLYQTLYLVATAMGLGGCALGSGDDVAAEQVLGLAARSEIVVGEFMLGSLPAEAAVLRHNRQADPTWLPLVEPNWGRE